jgi:hypothetical protein
MPLDIQSRCIVQCGLSFRLWFVYATEGHQLKVYMWEILTAATSVAAASLTAALYKNPLWTTPRTGILLLMGNADTFTTTIIYSNQHHIAIPVGKQVHCDKRDRQRITGNSTVFGRWTFSCKILTGLWKPLWTVFGSNQYWPAWIVSCFPASPVHVRSQLFWERRHARDNDTRQYSPPYRISHQQAKSLQHATQSMNSRRFGYIECGNSLPKDMAGLP